jgi:preprotein translocase subunit Sec63
MRIFLAVFILLCGVVLADPSFYDLLEINKEANEADIKRQFRKLSLKYHPDKNPGNRLGINCVR